MLFSCATALLLMVALQASSDAPLSKVKPMDLPVYSQMSLESSVVETLHQGDRVIVELEINSGAAWCKILEPDQPKSAGYVLCSQLDRPLQRDQKRWSVPSPQSSGSGNASVPRRGAETAQSRAAKSEVRQSLRDPEVWADRFNFTDEQRSQSADLLRSSGIPACRDRVAQLFRANGITDAYSGLKAMGNMGKSMSGMARMGQLGTELDRCGALYGSFWESFLKLMNPHQKAQLEKDPYLVLFLAQVVSDPSTDFLFYVLNHMNQR